MLDKSGVVWTSHAAEPDEQDAFQIVIPHGFLRAGVKYQLRIFGLDGTTRNLLGSYSVKVPAE
jgi:hypothetical protein